MDMIWEKDTETKTGDVKDNLLEIAWTIIANSKDFWAGEDADALCRRSAVLNWRDRYFEILPQTRKANVVEDQCDAVEQNQETGLRDPYLRMECLKAALGMCAPDATPGGVIVMARVFEEYIYG